MATGINLFSPENFAPPGKHDQSESGSAEIVEGPQHQGLLLLHLGDPSKHILRKLEIALIRLSSLLCVYDPGLASWETKDSTRSSWT